MDVRGKKVTVMGLGASGYASAKLLSRKGARVRVSDSSDGKELLDRADMLEKCSVPVELGGHTSSFCSDAEIAVVSPGIDIKKIFSDGILTPRTAVIGELELGFLFCRAPVVAITGTNGKSTTTELIGKILSVSGKHAIVCGNIGNPLCGEVEKLTDESIAVVEVSSFQLETINEFKPYISILLNVAEDHYDRHCNYEMYKNAKFRIFENQTSGDWAVLHSDFRGSADLDKIKSRVVFYGRDNGESAPGEYTGKDFFMKEEEVPIKGKHNMDNVLCAALVTNIMGVSREHISEGIKTFKALSHRFEKVAGILGIEFIDDSKATNIDATRRALESVNKKVVLIAGGKDKGGDYGSIAPLVRQKVKAMVLIGEAAPLINKAFSRDVPVFFANSMREAVKKSRDLASSGEMILLSPMCSSFDMYSGYKERGEVFRREVESLVPCGAG